MSKIYNGVVTFQKNEGGTKKIHERLNSITFKQQRPVLGEEVGAAHITAKSFPAFYFHFILVSERFFCCLLADWL